MRRVPPPPTAEGFHPLVGGTAGGGELDGGRPLEGEAARHSDYSSEASRITGSGS